MRAVRPRVSFAELSRWPDDGQRYELYDGEPIAVPAPNFRHQRIILNLAEVLREHERACGGVVVASPFDIVLSQYDVVQPDVVFFGPARRAQLNELEAAYIPPDLAVEVLSRATQSRDRGRKMRLLERYGLPEYWLVDPAASTIEAFAPVDGQLRQVAARTVAEELVSVTLAGLRFDVARGFAA